MEDRFCFLCEQCGLLLLELDPERGLPTCCERFMTNFSPVVSDNMAAQRVYIASRRAGSSHRLAEMFALGQPPGSRTDREFLRGHVNGNQFEGQDWVGDLYRREALAAGVNPTGKVYKASLAEYPGDPRAWVSGRGDVQRLCEERGWGVEGAVNLPVTKVAERTGGGLAKDIIDGKMQEILSVTPDAHRVDTEDLREQVKEKLMPHWCPKGEEVA